MGLCPEPLWELTVLLRPCSWILGGCYAAEKGGMGRNVRGEESKGMGVRALGVKGQEGKYLYDVS